jgi:pyruvate carboxylase
MPEFKKILVANRGEIAIRIMRAANELGKRTVAIYAEEDKLSLPPVQGRRGLQDRRRAGPGRRLSVDRRDRPRRQDVRRRCDPPRLRAPVGNPDLVDACAAAGIAFIGPKAETMRALGDKASARRVAIEAGVPVIPATEVLPDDMKIAQ